MNFKKIIIICLQMPIFAYGQINTYVNDKHLNEYFKGVFAEQIIVQHEQINGFKKNDAQFNCMKNIINADYFSKNGLYSMYVSGTKEDIDVMKNTSMFLHSHKGEKFLNSWLSVVNLKTSKKEREILILNRNKHLISQSDFNLLTKFIILANKQVNKNFLTYQSKGIAECQGIVFLSL